MIRASVTAGKNEKGERKEKGLRVEKTRYKKREMMTIVARQKTKPAVYKANV